MAFLFCVFSGSYWSIIGGKNHCLKSIPWSYEQLKLCSTVYFLLWEGFIDNVDHRMIESGVATITCLDCAFTLSRGENVLESGTDNQEADGSEAEWPSSKTALILAPYTQCNIEPSCNKSESSSQNTSNDADHNRLLDLSW